MPELKFAIYHRTAEICPVDQCIVALTNSVILTSQMNP